MNNPIIYLPGFNSGPQSEKSILLKVHFPELIVALYDTWDPDQGYQQLETLIASHLEQDLVLVGSSLGGFWSYQFAKKHGLKCVLLNPCMTPEVTLRPFVGKVENIYSGQQGHMPLENLLKYSSYRLQGNARCTVLHEKGDELIPFQESQDNFEGKAKLILLEGGNHRFTALPVAIEEIRKLQAA